MIYRMMNIAFESHSLIGASEFGGLAPCEGIVLTIKLVGVGTFFMEPLSSCDWKHEL